MIGKQLANYQVQAKLGEGGMGVVYKGVDLNLDRTVAIKVLPPELARDAELVERFRAEAKALAHLNHVNIATVYNYLNVGGQYLMIMEYVEGDTLAAIIERRGRIACEDAVRFSKQALLGLGYAHRAGIVHRDIKPGNIMLTREGMIKVMDFGIAKVLGAEHMTRSSGQLGTLAYMSPEQIRSEAVDARTDLYSLSVTLYEMLTARLPFTGRSEFDIMSAHLNTPPPKLTQYCPDLGPAIESVISKGLEKRPAARYQSAEEFGAALERAMHQPRSIVQGAKSQAHPAAQPPGAQSPLGRHSPPKPIVAAAAPPRVSPPASAPPVNPVSPPRGAAGVAPASPPYAAPHVGPASPPYAAPRGAAQGRVPVSPPYPQSRPPAQWQTTPGKRRNPVYSFLSLAVAVVILFCLLLGGLHNESVPMLLACVVLLYFLPILIAAILLKRNGATVVKLNALRGWTGIGWIQAMKEALADDE